MSNNWVEFYKARMNKSYRNHLRTRYKDTFDYIKSLGGETFGQFGCGMGNASRFLAEDLTNTKHLLIDICKGMLGLANENMLDSSPNHKYDTILGDIKKQLKTTKLDVIHSHGVLEHFSDDDIRKVIANQKELCDNLVHYVPSYKYLEPSFGDERLLKPQDWHDICKPDEIIESNDGYDLTLIWR